MKYIKFSELIFSLLSILFYYWLFTLGNDGIYIALTVLLIPTAIHIIYICDEDKKTSEVWKPLFISYSGIIILITALIIKLWK